MSATVIVPLAVVELARRHYRRTGRPYLLGGLAGDVRIDVSPGSRGRYLLTLDPNRAAEIGLLDLVEGETIQDRAAHTLLLLADAVVYALGGEPVTFKRDGLRVGRVEIVAAPGGGQAVRVRGHASLTCLAWLLRSGRSGYYLWLAAA